MANALKLKPYPGVPLMAEAAIEGNETEQALRAAQFRFDRSLHDLRSEYIVREGKLRDEYLTEVQSIHRLPNKTRAGGRQWLPGGQKQTLEE